jgi:hypothetical protein
MARCYVDDATLDAMVRVSGAVWFSLLEALGPRFAARATANMADFGTMYADNAYAEQLCNSLAQADETIHRREDVRAALYRIIDVLPPERQAKKREQK